jgi:hypothetical protein
LRSPRRSAVLIDCEGEGVIRDPHLV